MSRPVSEKEPLSVLLIEDDLEDARHFEEHLQNSAQKSRLRWEQTLEEGLDTLRVQPPDVIVADLGLSGRDGIETIERCVDVEPTVPIVGLIPQQAPVQARAAREAGAAQELPKEALSPELVRRTLQWAVERQHLEEKVSHRDAWIRSLTDDMLGAVYRATPEEGIEDANEAFLDLFGYESLEALRGTDPATLIAEPDARLVGEGDGELDEVEVSFRRKDGSTFVGRLTNRIVKDENGQPLFYGGTITDVTKRARVEQELEETKARHESFIEDVLYESPVGIFVLDADLDVVWTNEAIEDYFGLDRDDVIGTDKRQLVEDSLKTLFDEPEQFAETVLAAYEGNSYVERFECHVRSGPGRDERWLQHWSRPIEHGHYEGGRVEIYADVTERKNVEQALLEERDRFATLFHNLPTPVVHGYSDAEGRLRVQTVNEAFEEVFGHERQSIRGADIQNVLLPDDPEAKADAETLRQRLLSNKSVDQEIRRETADGIRDFQLQVGLRGEEGKGSPAEGYAIYTDITERKKRERQLQETTERLGAIIDAAPVAVVALDLDGKVELWNPAAEQIFGWTEDEVIGGPVPFVPEENWEEYKANRQRIYEGDVINGLETTRRTKDGTPIDLRLAAAPLRDSTGAVTGIMAVLEDITQLKQHERELRKTERRYQAVFEDPNILVGHLNPDGTVLDINRTALEYVDGSLDEIRGEPFWETPWFVGDDESQQGVQEWIDRAAAGEYVEFEVDHTQTVGTPLIVDGVIRPVTNEDGTVTSLLISGRDVTGRRQLEARLRDRGEKVESLYETTSHLLGAECSEEVATRIEKVLRSTFDYPLNGVYFVRGDTLVPAAMSPAAPERLPEVPALPLDGESLGAQALRSGETIVAEDLSELDSELDYGDLQSGACVPIGDHGVISIGSTQVGGTSAFDVKLMEILAAYATAVHDRIEHEQELRAAKEAAEEASHLKTAMLANMSHEIRTPLTSIIGFSEVLTEHLDGEMSRFADMSLRSSQRLMKTLDSVLQLSKLEAGAVTLEREMVALDQVAEETVELLRPNAEEKSVSLEVRSSEAPVEGHWNESGLIRITENLIENAIKFTPQGGTVYVRVRREGERGILEVEDTGIGISKEVLPRIFEAFKQESAGLEREYEGTGLGLSVVRRLVEEHEGTIDVDTEKGEGTHFSVRLPLSKSTHSEGGSS